MNTTVPRTNASPAWRGFNLPEMFVLPHDPRWPEMTRSGLGRFQPDHFRWIADWGFNFVRLPLSYRYWSRPESPLEIDEAAFAPIDAAVDHALRCGLHLSLNLHHVPGFCINQGLRDDFMAPEPFDLWRDAEALRHFVAHWSFIARRYVGVSANALSFDLVNEPARCAPAAYAKVVRATVAAIRAISPDRLIVIDGLDAGNSPCPDLVDLGLVQSCRGYAPHELTHHRAWWGGDHRLPPAWPMLDTTGRRWDRAALEAFYEPWFALRDAGVGVHCGELGAHNATPHRVFLAWLDDLLGVLGERGIGFALWNFHGSFGVLDNGRADAPTRDWHGLRLDHELLGLLQNHRLA
ncbi:MAG: glycoside hydrolase family 5 protein [Opitutaceae bacterium]|jgi:endoglucanase|nr:glycoside hydrolase family 5 protein [Opitutaceae bacterium]